MAEQEELLSVGQAQKVGLSAVVGCCRVHKGVERVDEPRRDLHKFVGPAAWLCSSTLRALADTSLMSSLYGLWSKNVPHQSLSCTCIAHFRPVPGLEQKTQVTSMQTSTLVGLPSCIHALPTWLEGRAGWDGAVVVRAGHHEALRSQVSDDTSVPEAFHRGAI